MSISNISRVLTKLRAKPTISITCQIMNFLSSALGSFSGYNIPYTFGERIAESVLNDYRSSSIWNVYNGTVKADGSECTIFEFEVKHAKAGQYYGLAKNAAKKLKSTRLPGVLKVLETMDTDSNIYIFAERVVPLSIVMKEAKLNQEVITLGVYTIARALKHLNNEGSLVHGNVDVSSVFVSLSGEWRLGGFEVMTNTKSDPEQSLFQLSGHLPGFRNILPPELALKGVDSLRGNRQIFKLDSFKLGGLIWCLFNELSDSSEISNVNQIQDTLKLPRTLVTSYKRLTFNVALKRASVEAFIVQAQDTFFKSSLIRCANELDELHLKSDSEKFEFMKSLELIKTVAPVGYMEYKVLPELIRLFNISVQPNNILDDMSNTATCLYYVLSFSENLSEPGFKRLVNPVIIQAFALPGRTIRVTLLTSLPRYVGKLSKSEVSDKIFPCLLSGFSDTNPTVREETLKAILPIASKLSDRQLNNELLRYLAKLQNDDKPEIRTNTIICLCKIAKDLNSNRSGVLITAFNKSLKDQFVPARVAVLKSYETCIDYFEPEICCSRVLSSVAPCLLDKSVKVRKDAKLVFDMYMKKIEQEAERLPGVEDEEETARVAETIDAGIQQYGMSLAFGAIAKMSGIGGNIENNGVVTPDIKTPQSSTPVAKPELFNNKNTSTKSLPSFRKPEVQDNWPEEEDDEFADDSWGFDDSEEVTKKIPTLKIGKLATKSAIKPAIKPKSSGLKLGATKKKLVLNLDDDGEDGWGDGW